MNYQIDFYPNGKVENEKLKYAVIISRKNGKWLFVRHKDRITWEIPGGHREDGEEILSAAKRELFEETGAINYEIEQICQYAVSTEDKTTYGGLFFAVIKESSVLPDSEIAEIKEFDQIPFNLTYPAIQPVLFEAGKNFLESKHI